MKNKQVQFFYFSGTGNTFLVVNKMREVLEELGAEVELLRLEESSPADVDLAKTIGVGFPVAILSTYPLVWNFIENLPRAQGTEIFIAKEVKQSRDGFFTVFITLTSGGLVTVDCVSARRRRS